MRRELYRNVKAVQALNAAAITTNTNTDGTSINLGQSGQNFHSVLFVAECTARTDGSYALVPQESVDGSTWVNVPADRVLGPSAALVAVNTCQSVGLVPDPGVSPYVRLRVTSTTVTSGGSVTAIALLGAGSNYPVQ